jgi:hypothetical protein|tara:strand:- start:6041 stop:6646 length:606 start_codon:yes stop_codon:yes gene_type:complete
MPHKKPGIAIMIAVKPSKKDTKKKYAGNAMPNNAMNKAWGFLKMPITRRDGRTIRHGEEGPHPGRLAYNPGLDEFPEQEGPPTQSFHPAIHGMMRRHRMAQDWNADDGPRDNTEEPWASYDDEVPTMPDFEDVKGMEHGEDWAEKPWHRKDFVSEAAGDYEPKGHDAGRYGDSLASLERSGQLKRRSTGLGPRGNEINFGG